MVAILVSTKVAVAHAERQTARPVEHIRQLEPADDLIRQSVDVLCKLLALAERQIVASIRGQRLLAYVAVAHVANVVIPGPVAILIAERAGPLIVRIEGKTPGEGLGQGYLQSIEFGILIVAVVADVVRPAALTGLQKRIAVNGLESGGRDVIRVTASCQCSSVVTLQQTSIRDTAICSDSV